MPIPPDLQIFFPNGGTSASQIYIWDGSKPVAWDGSISVTSTGSAIEDGSNPAIKATVFDLTNSNPLATQIVDANGDAITSFGGGVQYTDGDVDASVTGTAVMWRDSGDVMRSVTTSKPLPVNFTNTTLAVTGPLTDTQLRASAVPISAASLPLPSGAATSAKQDTEITALGTINTTLGSPFQAGGSIGNTAFIANAGTNLNTSALALETTLSTLNSKVTAVNTSAVVLATGSAQIGHLESNQSINLTQIAGGTAITGGVTGSLAVGGNVAHDGVNSGNPDYFGGEAIAFGTNPTAVAAADRTKFYGTRAGIPFFLGGHPNIITLEAAYTAAQTDTAIITVSSGAKIVVTQIQAITDEANTVAVGLRVGFASTNTPTTTGVVLTHPGIVPGSGLSRGDGTSIIGVGADGDDLRITSEVPTSGSLRILVSYFTIES